MAEQQNKRGSPLDSNGRLTQVAKKLREQQAIVPSYVVKQEQEELEEGEVSPVGVRAGAVAAAAAMEDEPQVKLRFGLSLLHCRACLRPLRPPTVKVTRFRCTLWVQDARGGGNVARVTFAVPSSDLSRGFVAAEQGMFLGMPPELLRDAPGEAPDLHGPHRQGGVRSCELHNSTSLAARLLCSRVRPPPDRSLMCTEITKPGMVLHCTLPNGEL
jgi:hypothetical protein